MAIIQSNLILNKVPAATADDMDVVAVRGEAVLAAPLVAGDIIEMAIVPAGSRIVDVTVDTSAAIGSASAEVADPIAGTAALAITAAALNGIARMNNPAAVQALSKVTDQMATVTSTVGGGTAGTVVGLTVSYRNIRQGE